jgi:phosphatidylserine decarboxylase
MIHKEGYPTLIISFVVFALLSALTKEFAPSLFILVSIVLLGLYLFLISFFRNPSRPISKNDPNILYAPADGKVVVIENTNEAQHLQQQMKQISIFMSPLNVHVNRHPINAEVIHSEHHDGKFMPAWEPKSATENERTTVIYNTNHGKIVMRQVAGALARRIVNYAKKGDKAIQGEDMGFIKFGSRVDLYLPLDADIKVNLNDVVKGNQTIIATFKSK